MIEEGIVQLVTSDSAVTAIAQVGGFLCELPKGQNLPSWTYRVVSDVSQYTLQARPGTTMRRIQIDCYGDPVAGAAQVVSLAAAIDNVLSGFAGVLGDADTTRVQGCFQSDLIDFFDTAGRTYRRMIEYEVWFSN